MKDTTVQIVGLYIKNNNMWCICLNLKISQSFNHPRDRTSWLCSNVRYKPLALEIIGQVPGDWIAENFHPVVWQVASTVGLLGKDNIYNQ